MEEATATTGIGSTSEIAPHERIDPNTWFGNTPSGLMLAMTIADIGDKRLLRKTSRIYQKFARNSMLLASLSYSSQEYADIAETSLNEYRLRALRAINSLIFYECETPLPMLEIVHWLRAVICARHREYVRVIRDAWDAKGNAIYRTGEKT